MKTVTYLRRHYLPFSQTFIYDEITHIKNLRKGIVTYLLEDDISEFPFPKEDMHFLEEWSPAGFDKYFDEKKTFHTDLFHAEFGFDAIPLVFSYRFRDVPLVVSFRGFDISVLAKGNPGVYRKIFTRAQAVLVRSEAMKKEIVDLGCPGNKVLVHHSGIDTERFNFVEREYQNIKNILSIGRFVDKKGLRYGIRALAKFMKKYPYIKYYIYGDGPLRDSLEIEIENSDVCERVYLGGRLYRREIPSKLYNADIFLLPSITSCNGDHEGIPVALMEAMSTGLPIISTKSAGIPELVEDGVSGFLAEERDIDGLYDNLCFLMENPDLCYYMGKNGRKKIEKDYNINIQTELLEQIYFSLT